MEKKSLVWNGIWNGKFSVWHGYGMEEIRQYGIWKNHLPFHYIACPACESKCYILLLRTILCFDDCRAWTVLVQTYKHISEGGGCMSMK